MLHQLPPFRYHLSNAALHSGVVVAPVVITSSTSLSVLENTTAVATLTATGGGTITWSLTGGADLSKFSIGSSSGALSFGTAPDFEVPTDADGNNVYVVQVRATNAITSDTKTLSVTVTDVPDAIADPHFDYVVYLSGFEGADASTVTVDEATGKAVTTVGNAQIDTAQFKFGTSSLLLDGTGDYLSLADHEHWNIGTNQFTIEAWVRFSNLSKFHTVLSQATAGSVNFYFYHSAPSAFRFEMAPLGGGTTMISGTWTPALNTWYHIAVDRDAANKVRLYANGVMMGSGTITGGYNSSASLMVGRNELNTAFDFQGWLDEIRFTKGIARYASDAGFAVPTAAFPRLGPVTITSVTSFTIVQDTTAVATLTATGGGTMVWSLVGGADVAKFSINASTGALSFLSAPDFETPTDADANNIYVVEVRASNAASSDTKTLNVTVAAVSQPSGPVWAWFQPSTLGAGASAVSQWNDSGPSARHATQATSANQPIVVANAINSHKAIRLVDSTDGLALPSMAALVRGATFLVLKGDFDGTTIQGFPVQPIVSGTEGRYPWTDGDVYCGWMKNDRQNVGNPSQALNAWHILSIHSAPSDYRIYINNVLFYSTASSTPAFSSTPFIGKTPSGTSEWLGHIAEVVQFSNELTTTDRTTEYNRLKTKFGL